ncbi:flagellar hook-associated protein 2 [Bacillus sp. 31A1R]|uniref:Flagellar hook-associated protein 2 n=1 Tax=Robertmurraya mangrovi TaxID=3098077 RepID=A0ABU5IXU8_9BACI|nr:flagellar hook-associated protein 2 [Bacillus sp. 31A1R]MDZ5471977.1 flagellar hook-associated protein 2 [Bacillus sp. 31A1R]
MNSIRFSGLASGLDTQSIVDSMMKAERLPLDRIKQKKQVVEWQRDNYRDMNKLLKEFDTFIFDNIYKQSKMLKRTVTSSNTEFVTATASAEAGNVSYSISNVTLATAARRQSSTGISKVEGTPPSPVKIDSTKSLWSQKNNFASLQQDPPVLIPWKQTEVITNNFSSPTNGANEFQLTKGAVSDITFPIAIKNGATEVKAYQSTDVIIGEIPTTRAAGKVYIDDSSGKIVFGDIIEEGHTFEVKFKHNYIDFEVKTYNEAGQSQYKNFSIDGSTSLINMFSTINRSNAGINIFYDSSSDKVVANRTDTGNFNTTGDGSEINFVNVTRDANGAITSETNNSFFTSVLRLSADVPGTGTDARFTINGLETTRKSNTFTMNDVTFTLKKNSTGSEISTINIKSDTDEIVKNIKDFFDKYNELVGKINGKIKEERFTTFTPLTDEQRAGMKEKEIEQWEEKAKSGLLRRDSLLTSGLSKLRMDMYAEVTANATTRTNSKYNQLTELGIKTTKDYLDGGKLEIDEEKLKAALEADPEAVYQLFMADGPNYQQQGLARRLRSSISDTMKKIEEKAGNSFKTDHGYSMGKDLLRMKSSIDSFEDRLRNKEKRYWEQYTSMEKAMQKMNDQSSQLMAQLGSMMGSK